MRLFIAEDEAIIRMGLKSMATSLGHVVVGTAARGDQIYDQVNQTKPDLILLDIRMPGHDGLAVAKQLIKKRPLPIVVLSAYTDMKLIEQAATIPVMGYLVKPIHEGKLAPMLQLAQQRFLAVQTQTYTITKDELVMCLM